MALSVASTYSPNRSETVYARLPAADLLLRLGHELRPMQDATVVTRDILTGLRGRDSLLERVGVTGGIRDEFHAFLDGGIPTPSLRSVLFDDSRVYALREIVAGVAAGEDEGQTIARLERLSPFSEEEPDLSTGAPQLRRANLYQLRRRLIDGEPVVSDLPRSKLPQPLSLRDLTERPEYYQRELGLREVEVVVFDHDGCILRGESIGRLPVWSSHLYSLWITMMLVRHGPRATVGQGWGRLGKTMWEVLKLVAKEKKEVRVGEGTVEARIGPLLRGHERKERVGDQEVSTFPDAVDVDMARKSYELLITHHGRRGRSRFVLDEIAHHTREGRLPIVISASPRDMVRLNVADLIPGPNVFGTWVGRFPEGHPNAGRASGELRVMREEMKPRILREEVILALENAGYAVHVPYVYTDSASDMPLAHYVSRLGGVTVAVNPWHEELADKVLAQDAGIVVREEQGLTRVVRRTIQYLGLEGAIRTNQSEVIGDPPGWPGDIGRAALRASTDGVGWFLGSASTRLISNLGHHQPAFESIPSKPAWVAAVGFLASLFTTFLLPERAPVSVRRRLVMRGIVPLTATMTAAGVTGDFPHWAGIPAVVAAVTGAAVAADLLTGGERVLRDAGGDEFRSVGHKTVGFSILRFLHTGIYRGILAGLQHLSKLQIT